MKTGSGTGNTTGVALYTSALAAGACTPVIRLSAASNPATLIDLNHNGQRVQRAGNGSQPALLPVDVQPGDAFTYDISGTSGGTWAFEFLLYPEGDVAA